MCGLFGMLDYGKNFTGRQRAALLSALAAESEARGTDAAGIAYSSRGVLHVYKRPVPAHKLRFSVPDDASVIMGHTRMATQGNAKRNCNNHPFLGRARNCRFALAHNGVLRNDRALRRQMKLPRTKIQTDSYAAVQLIERKNALDLASLQYMAEQVEGSFTFTVLDERNNWYLVKGDNPLCLYHDPGRGLYLYASTEEILDRALTAMRLRLAKPERVELTCGDLLKIAPDGSTVRNKFDNRFFRWSWSVFPEYSCTSPQNHISRDGQEYLSAVKSVAASLGYAPESVDHILEQGGTLEEVEDFLYCERRSVYQ